jgi:hypothetical protein
MIIIVMRRLGEGVIKINNFDKENEIKNKYFKLGSEIESIKDEQQKYKQQLIDLKINECINELMEGTIDEQRLRIILIDFYYHANYINSLK